MADSRPRSNPPIQVNGKWGAVVIVLMGLAVLIAVGAFPKLSDIKTKVEAEKEHRAMMETHVDDMGEVQQDIKSTLDLMRQQETRWEASQQETKAKLEKLETRSYQILQEVRRR